MDTSVTIYVNRNVHLKGSMLKESPFYTFTCLDKYILKPSV